MEGSAVVTAVLCTLLVHLVHQCTACDGTITITQDVGYIDLLKAEYEDSTSCVWVIEPMSGLWRVD